MSHDPFFALAALSDQDLLGRTEQLARGHARLTAVLVAHLAELDARRLYLAEGFPSLYAYCIHALRLSEYAAYNRIEAARVARRFPVVLRLLASGDLLLSAVGVLARHLTSENCESLIETAAGKSKREVERLVAGLAPSGQCSDTPGHPSAATCASRPTLSPRAQVRIRIRAGTEEKSFRARGRPPGRAVGVPRPGCTELSLFGPEGLKSIEESNWPAKAASQNAPDSPVTARPSSPELPEQTTEYRITLTFDAATWGELETARDLLRHSIPDGNLNLVMARAVRELADRLATRKHGGFRRMDALAEATKAQNPDAARDPDRLGDSRSRDLERRHRRISAGVRRAVWARDQGRCAFVAASGRRCPERGRLEFHHRRPVRAGGVATLENIELRCRAHNAHAESGEPSEWRRSR